MSQWLNSKTIKLGVFFHLNLNNKKKHFLLVLLLRCFIGMYAPTLQGDFSVYFQRFYVWRAGERHKINEHQWIIYLFTFSWVRECVRVCVFVFSCERSVKINSQLPFFTSCFLFFIYFPFLPFPSLFSFLSFFLFSSPVFFVPIHSSFHNLHSFVTCFAFLSFSLSSSFLFSLSLLFLHFVFP